MRYRIFHIVVESNLPLPELRRIADTKGRAPDIAFRIAKAPFFTTHEPSWFYRWFSNNDKSEIALEAARHEDGYYLRFPGLADFMLNLGKGQVHCFPAPTTPPQTIRHLLLDQVIPRWLAHQGHLVLHASAVVTKAGAGVAFLGKSGWGKSTIASSFHQHGARLISDDSLLLIRDEGILMGVPAYPGSRLWQDSAESVFPGRQDFTDVTHYSDKKRLILHHCGDGPQKHRINAIFLLSDPEKPTSSGEIKIRQVGGADAIMTMIKRTFSLDIESMPAVARQFNSASSIATTNPAVYSLVYPRDYVRLEGLRAAICERVDAQHYAAQKAAC